MSKGLGRDGCFLACGGALSYVALEEHAGLGSVLGRDHQGLRCDRGQAGMGSLHLPPVGLQTSLAAVVTFVITVFPLFGQICCLLPGNRLWGGTPTHDDPDMCHTHT